MESVTKDSGDGGGSEDVDARIEGGVDHGLDEGEALRRKLVRREAKKAVLRLRSEDYYTASRDLGTDRFG